MHLSKRLVVPALAFAAFGLAACSAPETPSDQPGTVPPVWTGREDPGASGVEADAPVGEGASIAAELRDVNGREAGTVDFVDEGSHLQLSIKAQGLTPGFHGLHIHSVGKCEANSVAPAGGEPGAFLSSGGHLQVDGRTGHPSSGDLTSLNVNSDGTATLVTTTDTVTLDDLRAEGAGTSIVIHSGPDNFANIPPRYVLPDGAAVPDMATLMTGDSGTRVACAVLK